MGALHTALSFAWLPVALLLGVPATAQEGSGTLALGGDHFAAGQMVTCVAPGVDDLFLAGDMVRGITGVAGSAHLVGRDVAMLGAVGGDAYLAGMDVVLSGPVTGDATVAGYRVRVGEVGGDLRAAGGTVVVDGPVAGYALLSGDTVRVDGEIRGDAYLAGDTLDFAKMARVAGRLIVFEEPIGLHEIPEDVAPADRVERRDLSEFDDAAAGLESEGRTAALLGFLVQVLWIGGLAVLFAVVRPRWLASLRRGVLERPWRALVTGFVAESAVMGSVVLFGLTVVGLVLVPVSLLLVFLVGFAGYVVGAYALGVRLLAVVGRAAPEVLPARVLAAVVGAAVARALAPVPYLGWFLFLALTLAGVGALASELPWLRRGDAPRPEPASA